MRRGKNYVDVWIRENEYEWVAQKVYVEWEYDPHGGNEVRPYWFDYTVIEYPISDEYTKEKIDNELRDMSIEDIMITEED